MLEPSGSLQQSSTNLHPAVLHSGQHSGHTMFYTPANTPATPILIHSTHPIPQSPTSIFLSHHRNHHFRCIHRRTSSPSTISYHQLTSFHNLHLHISIPFFHLPPPFLPPPSPNTTQFVHHHHHLLSSLRSRPIISITTSLHRLQLSPQQSPTIPNYKTPNPSFCNSIPPFDHHRTPPPLIAGHYLDVKEEGFPPSTKQPTSAFCTKDLFCGV